MDRNTLQKLLDARLARHQTYVAEGQRALIRYVKEDERMLRRLHERPEYQPGSCMDCGELIPEYRLKRTLAIECVTCLTRHEGGRHGKT